VSLRARPADLDWDPVATLVRRHNVETLESIEVEVFAWTEWRPGPRRSSEVIEVGTELLGDLWPGGPVHLDGRDGAESMVSVFRVTEVGRRRRLSRPDRPREGGEDVRTLIEEAALFGLWADLVSGTTSMSAEETRLPRPRRPGPAHPHGGVGGRPVKEETGRRVGRLFSSSVIGTSSHLIEPHPDDDETERRVFSRRT